MKKLLQILTLLLLPFGASAFLHNPAFVGNTSHQGTALTPQFVNTLIDFHTQSPNTQYSYVPFLDAWGNTNFWTLHNEGTFNPTLWTNFSGPDISFGITIQTDDGHQQSSTGTHWLKGDFGDTGDGEALQYGFSPVSMFTEAISYGYIGAVDNVTTANSRDLWLLNDNPYAVAQQVWQVGTAMTPAGGIHSTIGGAPSLVTSLPTNTFIKVTLFEDNTNGFAFVTYENATNGNLIYSSICYGTPGTGAQDVFQIKDGYIAEAGMKGFDLRGSSWVNHTHVNTNRIPYIPLPPSGLSVVQSGQNQALVSWNDNCKMLNPVWLDLNTNGSFVSKFTNNITIVTNTQVAFSSQTNFTLDNLPTNDLTVRVYSYFPVNGAESAKVTSATVTITNIPPNTNDFLVWYKLNGNANDVAGVHNGTENGTFSYVTGEDSVSSHAINLDGATAYVDCGTFAVPTVNFSFQAWVNPDGFQSLDTVLSKGYDGTDTQTALYLDGSGFAHFGWYNGSTHEAVSTHALSTLTWHFLVGTYNGTTWKIYVDGVLDGSTDDSLIPVANSTKVSIGANSVTGTASQFFVGTVDDARICDHVETLDEVNIWFGLGAR